MHSMQGYYGVPHPIPEAVVSAYTMVRTLAFEFTAVLTQRVLDPLDQLFRLYANPLFIIEKRAHKLLDYEICTRKAKAAKVHMYVCVPLSGIGSCCLYRIDPV